MRFKYPRTFHLPWSPGATSDDKVMKSTSSFNGRRVIVTTKMDGENTSLYQDYLHARSMDGSGGGEERSMIKAFHAQIRDDIPEYMRVCVENLYARHSIHYDDLETYFMGISVWEENKCYSWDNTLTWFMLLGITPVPVLYDGIYNEDLIKTLHDDRHEGYVVRLAEPFYYDQFPTYVGKYVRAGHVQTDQHWRKTWVKNNLKENTS